MEPSRLIDGKEVFIVKKETYHKPSLLLRHYDQESRVKRRCSVYNSPGEQEDKLTLALRGIEWVATGIKIA
jgi:hypothetical protein